MDLLLSARTMPELKLAYKKLANTFHPDRGGDIAMMQKINDLYQNCINKLKISQTENDFSNLQVGMTVYVNGTPCEVLAVNKDTFRVVAKGRSRQAIFDKQSGIGRFNSRLRASFNPEKFARFH